METRYSASSWCSWQPRTCQDKILSGFSLNIIASFIYIAWLHSFSRLNGILFHYAHIYLFICQLIDLRCFSCLYSVVLELVWEFRVNLTWWFYVPLKDSLVCLHKGCCSFHCQEQQARAPFSTFLHTLLLIAFLVEARYG